MSDKELCKLAGQFGRIYGANVHAEARLLDSGMHFTSQQAPWCLTLAGMAEGGRAHTIFRDNLIGLQNLAVRRSPEPIERLFPDKQARRYCLYFAPSS